MIIKNILEPLSPSWNIWHKLSCNMDEIESLYDPKNKVLLIELKHHDSPTLTLKALNCIYEMQNIIVSFFERFPNASPHYVIWASANQKAFCLGLDMSYIFESIRSNNEKMLRKYIERCADVMFINYHNLDLPLINLAVIDGNAYGGGLSFALSSDVVFARDNIACCLSEIKCNILPPIGALFYSLKLKIDDHQIDELFSKRHEYSINELIKIDAVNFHYKTDPTRLIDTFVNKSSKHFSTYSSLYKQRKKSSLLGQSYIPAFVDMWLASAFNLTDKEHKRLEKIVDLQNNMIDKFKID